MDSRPDIIWIYCDELRTDALGCYGHPTLTLHTPNLDRMAERGVRFTNNFCNSPVCVSSRVCSLTSQPPEVTGVYNNEGAWANFQLPRPVETFPPLFAANGYRTANFGKIHVAREMMPGEPEGVEIFQHHDGAGGEMGIWQHLGEERVSMLRSPIGGMNGGIFPDDEPYPPQQVTDNALAWLTSSEEPSFARLSILQPHTPVLPPARFVRLYEDQDPGLPGEMPATTSAFERRVAETHDLTRMAPDRMRDARRHYYAQVAWVDEEVGRVLSFLEENGRMERTVILFTADHGNPIGDTGAFEKHTYTPSVHRVPFILAGAGIAEGQTRADICDSLDIGPTLLAAAGLARPESFCGRDLMVDPEPEAIFSTIGFGEPDSRMGPNGGRGEWFNGSGWPRRSCIRTSRYRLDKNMRIDAQAVTPEDEDIFLADLIRDPAEMVNRAADPQYAAIVADLSARLDSHAEGAIVVPPECLVRKKR